MFVIRQKLKENEKEIVQYNIEKIDTGIIFSFKTIFMNQNISDKLFLSFEKYKDKIFHISIQQTHKIETKIYSIYELPSRYKLFTEYNNAGMNLARISISPDCQDIAIILSFPTNYICNSAKTINWNPNISKAKMMLLYSPYYRKRAEQYRRKYEMMSSLDIYDSITYLESQVDALTKYILKNGNQDDLLQILKEADKDSVLNIKSKEKIINELNHDKAKVRKLQEVYYDKTKKSSS